MSLPFFYIEPIADDAGELFLNEDTSRHVAQVLRMQAGEKIQLTNGKGKVFIGEIIDNNKKKCSVRILSVTNHPEVNGKTGIAISLLKNTSRFEWFLEKATEIGVNEIIPLICTRTEKQQFRYDRMNNILISAMLQSQQAWLPVLHEPMKYAEAIKQTTYFKKFIAHCETGEKQQLSTVIDQSVSQLILVGPEGDFTKEEIAAALQNNFTPVALGNTRLRTETAAIVAATILCVP